MSDESPSAPRPLPHVYNCQPESTTFLHFGGRAAALASGRVSTRGTCIQNGRDNADLPPSN